MANQFRQRPSALVGVSDPYAAYCFDEAVYYFGTHVESELRRVSDGKKPEEAKRQRQAILTQLLTDPPEVQADGGPPSQYDPTDPLSREKQAEMQRKMPAVKFTGMSFADPSELFDGTKKPKSVKHV